MITLTTPILHKIEARFGSPIRYPKDCEALSVSIYRSCGVRLSVTTLKRFFGFAKSVEKPRLYTLDVIAVYVGYKDWSSLMAERTSEKAEPDTLLGRSTHDHENDVYLLRHQLLQSLATADIDIPAVERLCRQFGKTPEITPFVIEIINLAGRAKNLQFLKNVYALPHVFNPKYHDMAHFYYVCQSVGVAMRNNPDLTHELVQVYGQNKIAQQYLIEWFVDEDNLQGYYGQLLEVYHQHKNKQLSDRLFYYLLKYSASLQTDVQKEKKKWLEKIREVKFSRNIHPILAGRYYGVMLAEQKQDLREKLQLQEDAFQQYVYNDTFENAISFLLYMTRYLFFHRCDELLAYTAAAYSAYVNKISAPVKSHWGVKIENELNIYIAYGHWCGKNRKPALDYFNRIDVNLFEIFMYKQIHQDYITVAETIRRQK